MESKKMGIKRGKKRRRDDFNLKGRGRAEWQPCLWRKWIPSVLSESEKEHRERAREEGSDIE